MISKNSAKQKKQIRKITAKTRIKKRVQKRKLLKRKRSKRTIRSSFWQAKKEVERRRRPGATQLIIRPEENPIITPKPEHEWEAWQTFNPGAILLEDKVHFLYRAIGEDGISRLGYAVSSDGFKIDERLSYPVYQHQFKNNNSYTFPSPELFNIYSYLSGGGWGGVEDPRLTLIDDRIFMLYVALESGLPQLTMTSIRKSDFLNRNWNWQVPKNISPPGVIVKSGALFPEKIGAKYAIFYRIFPNIWIDFVDDLDFKNGKYLNGKPCIKIRKDSWDSRKIGVGAPPIKTKYGWLLIYYGVDERESSKYKIGAMLLDLENPCRVLVRPDRPILEPDEWYENEGHKAGIMYPCGAVVKNNKLLIYYGGADSYVAVAYSDFEKFLEELVRGIKPKIERKILKKKK